MEEKVCLKTIKDIANNLKRGIGVKVKKISNTKILRIEWLNLYNEPIVLMAIGKVITYWINTLGYKPDAIASIETSGAKYGISTSLYANIPYFSLHKIDKVIFEEPVYVESRSVTESRALKLYADSAIVRKFSHIVLVDDIRRTSNTIDSAVELIERCGGKVDACFIVLDFKFAGHPYPKKLKKERLHSLFTISKINDDGTCIVDDGLAIKFLKKFYEKNES
jgi:adenine/guanine phosphoribosyltransferase-like PRPP-binding protein